MNLFSLILGLAVFFASCKGAQQAPSDLSTETGTGVLVFKSGYGGSSAGTPADAHTDITGVEPELPSMSDWQQTLEQVDGVGQFFLYYETGTPSQRFAKIIDDPTSPGNRVLHFWLNEAAIPYDDGTKYKGRIQATLSGNSALREFTLRHRLYIHSDLAALKSAPSFGWLTIQEFWNNLPDETFPFRISINIQKPSDTDTELRLGAHGQVKSATGWDNVWESVNTTFPLPVGEWITLQTYVREGSAQDGVFQVLVTDKTGTTTTLIDVQGFTHHPDDPAPAGFGNFNPMKLYAPDRIIDPMRTAGLTLQLYWDDFELWLNGKPPSN